MWPRIDEAADSHSLRDGGCTISHAIRAGFALTVITAITAVMIPAAAQSNSYRQVEWAGSGLGSG